MKDFAESFEPDTQVPRKEKIVSTSGGQYKSYLALLHLNKNIEGD